MTPEEKAAFIAEISAAVKAATAAPILTPEEHQWVKMAIQKEAQAIAFRKAVIEKSLIGLIWAGIAFMGNVLYQWAQAHGYKP